MIRVQRVVRVVVEGELPHPRTPTGLVVVHELEIPASLERVHPLRPGDIVTDAVQPIFSRLAEALIEGKIGAVDARAGQAERHARHDIQRVDLGEILRHRPADVAPAHVGPVAVRVRLEPFSLPPNASLQLVDERRAEDLVPAAVHRAVREDVGAVEVAPLRGTGGDFAAILVRVECSEDAPVRVVARRPGIDAEQVVPPRVV